MNPEVEKLVERLGEIAHHFESTGYAHGQHVAKARAAKEAATTLQSLTARIAELEGERGYFAQVFTMLVSEVERGPGGHGKLLCLSSEQWRHVESATEKAKRSDIFRAARSALPDQEVGG